MEHVGTAQSPTWVQSLDLPHTGSHRDSRSSLRTTETVEGLRLTQLGPDETSLLCKIYRYDQWTPHRRGASIHSQRGSFLVKNTEALLQNPRCLSLTKASTPCCGPRTEGQLLPWPSTTVPRRRTQSPWRERCRLRAILTPRPQGHSPSCRISLWGGVRVPTGVYIGRPLHPPSWEPIATPFTISGTIGGCICHFLKLKYQWASESSTSPYMNNMVLWPPVSVVLRAGLPDCGWSRKLTSKTMSTILSSDYPGQFQRTVISCRIRLWNSLDHEQ